MGKNSRLNMQIKKNRHYPCKKQMMPVFCALAGVLLGTAGGVTGIFEDIAESFMQFVLSDRQEGDSLAATKINFFYDYPEMTAKRDYIRQNFGYE